jgi:hypothetical protein
VEKYVYSGKRERLLISNFQLGLLNWFYNRGHERTCSIDEGLLLDQRQFGPAVARGLLDNDGSIWYLTQAGLDFIKQYTSQEPWKDSPSRQFSHYIHIQRSKLKLVSKPKRRGPDVTRPITRARSASA